MRSTIFLSYPRQPTSTSPSLSLSPSSCPLRRRPTTLTRPVLCCDTFGVTDPPHHCCSLASKYALGASDDEDAQDDAHDDIAVTVRVTPVESPSSSCSSVSSTSSAFHAAMSIRNKTKRHTSESPATSSPSSTTTGHSRPTTPTSPVQIPRRSLGDEKYHLKKDFSHHRRQRKQIHSTDSISPSVAALLALTDIPRPQRRRRRVDRSFTLEEIVSDQHVSEKAFSLSLGRGPLDLLLSPPEDLPDDDFSALEGNIGSVLARTTSADSVPSLGGESLSTDMASSLETPRSISSSAKRRHSLMRKSLEPVRSPPDATKEHPLAAMESLEIEELVLPPAERSDEDNSSYPLLQPFKPLRSAFKSNLTASLRALRLAAKSFSNLNFPSIAADDFLTRSILTIDPNVPYMDERRPPVTGEMPSAELRRYLNPTTSSHLDSRPKPRAPGTFSASIQMQTYKVHRSRSAPPSPRTPSGVGNASRPPSPVNGHHAIKTSQHTESVPGMRQREMRENPDFIRIAVMEMAMRRRGKLDNQKPGRARWVLPPRRASVKPYEVGSNGVPIRWIPVTY